MFPPLFRHAQQRESGTGNTIASVKVGSQLCPFPRPAPVIPSQAAGADRHSPNAASPWNASQFCCSGRRVWLILPGETQNRLFGAIRGDLSPEDDPDSCRRQVPKIKMTTFEEVPEDCQTWAHNGPPALWTHQPSFVRCIWAVASSV